GGAPCVSGNKLETAGERSAALGASRSHPQGFLPVFLPVVKIFRGAGREKFSSGNCVDDEFLISILLCWPPFVATSTMRVLPGFVGAKSRSFAALRMTVEWWFRG